MDKVKLMLRDGGHVKGCRLNWATQKWESLKKLPKSSKAFLSTVKGREKRALKHAILRAKGF